MNASDPESERPRNPDGYWYTRREGVVRGPMAASLVTKYLLLGRIRIDDELSQDRVHWELAGTVEVVLPAELQHLAGLDDYRRLVEARAGADERSGDRRCAGCSNCGDCTERRRGAERRQDRVDPVEHYFFTSLFAGKDRQAGEHRLRTILLLLLLGSLAFAWLVPIAR